MAKDQVIISQGGLLLQVFGTQRVRPPFYARGVFPGVYTSRELFNLSCPRPGVGLAREKWGGLPRPEPHRIWRPAIPGFVPVDCFASDGTNVVVWQYTATDVVFAFIWEHLPTTTKNPSGRWASKLAHMMDQRTAAWGRSCKRA